MFMGHEAHSIQNFGGKSVPPVSSRAKKNEEIESEVESIHSDAPIQIKNRIQRPKMNLEGSRVEQSGIIIQSKVNNRKDEESFDSIDSKDDET